jgi:hypothetical protein
MVLFSLSLFSLGLTMLLGTYLAAAIIKRHTSLMFAGESMSQATGFVAFAAIVGMALTALPLAVLTDARNHSQHQPRRDRLSRRLSVIAMGLLTLEFLVAMGNG